MPVWASAASSPARSARAMRLVGQPGGALGVALAVGGDGEVGGEPGSLDQ